MSRPVPPLPLALQMALLTSDARWNEKILDSCLNLSRFVTTPNRSFYTKAKSLFCTKRGGTLQRYSNLHPVRARARVEEGKMECLNRHRPFPEIYH